MRAKEFLSESLDHKTTKAILGKFVDFAAEHLKLDQYPNFDFVTGTERSVQNKSFGGYGSGNITISISNRHIMDVCRTLAHEMVHFKQDLEGRIDYATAGADGSPIENEANAEAAVIMRKWGKLHPNLFAQESVE